MQIFDAYSNLILSTGIINPASDIDSLVIGPVGDPVNQITLRITDIIENVGIGTYNLKFLVTKSGIYEIYTRVTSRQISTYPLNVEAVSNQASAAQSYILESPVSPSVAGALIVLNLKILDAFGNLSTDDTIPVDAQLILSGIVNYTGVVTKLSTAIYKIEFTPTIRGDYSLQIKIFDKSEVFTYIKDMPQIQIVYPDFISIATTTYNGTGLSSGRFGFTETYSLYI